MRWRKLPEQKLDGHRHNACGYVRLGVVKFEYFDEIVLVDINFNEEKPNVIIDFRSRKVIRSN